jgi:hypothetical protein
VEAYACLSTRKEVTVFCDKKSHTKACTCAHTITQIIDIVERRIAGVSTKLSVFVVSRRETVPADCYTSHMPNAATYLRDLLLQRNFGPFIDLFWHFLPHSVPRVETNSEHISILSENCRVITSAADLHRLNLVGIRTLLRHYHSLLLGVRVRVLPAQLGLCVHAPSVDVLSFRRRFNHLTK